MARSDTSSSENEKPFHVVVGSPAHDPVAEPEIDDSGWTEEDLEAEYQKAVEAAEQAELISELTFDALGATSDGYSSEESVVESDSTVIAPAAVAEAAPTPATIDESLDIPRVLEALVFVGGASLTSRRLAEIIGASNEVVDDAMSGLARRYESECRPYSVRIVDGCYRLVLNPTFETVRNRVHGLGPKEVKLTPELLEVLAFVAYQQPVGKEEFAETGKKDIDSSLRQLIRRDLVAVTREGDGSVRYMTTPRFLELFSLRSLHDLPRSEDMRFK